jgi:hypothetical protein
VTFEELLQKYENAAQEVRSMVDAKVEANWDFHSTDETYHTVFVHTPEDDDTGDVWEVYDRADSPADREVLGSGTDTLWVVLHSDGREVTATTLRDAILAALTEGWLPPQPNPTIRGSDDE